MLLTRSNSTLFQCLFFHLMECCQQKDIWRSASESDAKDEAANDGNLTVKVHGSLRKTAQLNGLAFNNVTLFCKSCSVHNCTVASKQLDPYSNFISACAILFQLVQFYFSLRPSKYIGLCTAQAQEWGR